MKNLYIGFDPSYTAFGVSLINEVDRKLIFNQFSRPVDRHSTLIKFRSITDLVCDVKDWLEDFVVDSRFENTYAGEEVSTVYTGYFAPELYALDYKLYYEMSLDFIELKIYSPSILTKVVGHKSSNKEKTIFLVEDIVLPIFEKHGYSIEKLVEADTKTDIKIKSRWVRRRTMTDGEADSFIYCLIQFIEHSEDLDLVSDLLVVLPKLLKAEPLS